jgi:uncharacterized protein YggE
MPVWGSSITQPWGVSSFGQSDIHAEPDYAVLQVAINRLHNKPKSSLEAAKAAASAVRTTVRRRGVSDDGVTSSRTSVQSAWDGYGAGRKFLGHQCRVEFAVRSADLDQVDQILIDVVDAGADEIISVKYDTSMKPELRAQARRDAVDAAQRKAALYAEAAGVSLGPVVHIEDVDPEQLRMESHRGGGGGAGESGDLAPGRVTVSAAVQVGFSLRH